MFSRSLIFLCIFLQTANATTAIKLEDIEQYVHDKNKHVEKMRLLKEASEIQTGYFSRSFLPDLSVSVANEKFKKGTTLNKSGNALAASASLNVFRGGSDFAEGQKRNLLLQLSDTEMNSAHNEQLALAYEFYWASLAQQKKLKALEDFHNQNQKNLSMALRRISAGVATKTDKLEFEMMGQEITNLLVTENLVLKGMKNELKVLLGVHEDFTLVENGTHLHQWQNEISSLDVEKMNEVKEKDLEVQILDKERQVYLGKLLPAVDLFAEQSIPTQRIEPEQPLAKERKETVFGVKATWSFGEIVENSLKRSSLLKEKEARLKEKEDLMMHTSYKQLNIVEKLKALHDLLHGTEENIKNAESYLVATLNEYTRGVKNSPDVLEATSKLYQAKSDFLSMMLEFNQALYKQKVLNRNKL
jgi:outer membrane protein TolC